MNKTDEELNVALAELLGWKFHPEFPDGPNSPAEFTTETPDGRLLCGYYPDYCKDLNAAHEAEACVGTKWTKYCQALLEIVEPEPRSLDVCHYWNLLHATARQRAEALYQTLISSLVDNKRTK